MRKNTSCFHLRSGSLFRDEIEIGREIAEIKTQERVKKEKSLAFDVIYSTNLITV